MEYPRFPGALMSLLAPAKGMSTLRPRQEVCKRWPQRPFLACLPLKLGGFSRPSSFTHSGVSPRPHLPQNKEGFGSDTSHAEKAVFFFKESRIFHLLGQFIPRLNKIQCAGQLNGMEGGDSSGNSTSLKTPQSGFLEEAEAVPAESVRLQWKSTVPAHLINWIFCSISNYEVDSPT